MKRFSHTLVVTAALVLLAIAIARCAVKRKQEGAKGISCGYCGDANQKIIARSVRIIPFSKQ